jgi:hypothetical protein
VNQTAEPEGHAHTLSQQPRYLRSFLVIDRQPQTSAPIFFWMRALWRWHGAMAVRGLEQMCRIGRSGKD